MSATQHAFRAIQALDPCGEAIAWLAANHGKTPLQLWRGCERADWMLRAPSQARIRKAQGYES